MRAGLLIVLSLLIPWCAFAADGAAPAAPDRPAAPARGADGGKWQIAVERAADGAKVVVATLLADAPIRSGFGQVTPKLILRYRTGRPSAYIVFDTFLGSGTADATVTFGTVTERQAWAISEDGRAAFPPGDALDFMTRLKPVDTFSVRISPRRGEPVTATFTVTGVEVVIKALISAGVKYAE